MVKTNAVKAWAVVNKDDGELKIVSCNFCTAMTPYAIFQNKYASDHLDLDEELIQVIIFPIKKHRKKS